MTVQTATNVIQQVRRIADIETDGYHITDQEILDYLNDSLRQLWSVTVNSSNGSIFSKVSTKLVQLGDDSRYYQLPSDFLRLVSVDVRFNNNWMPSQEADQQAYAQLLELTSSEAAYHYLYYNNEQGRYELVLFPNREPNDILIRYVPEATQLDDFEDVLHLPGDWERWAVYDAAIKCKMKDDENAEMLMMERARIEAMIVEDVKAQTVATVKTIRDMTARTATARYLPDIR